MVSEVLFSIKMCPYYSCIQLTKTNPINPTLLHLPLLPLSFFQKLPSPVFSNTDFQKSYHDERRLSDRSDPGLTGSLVRAAAHANAAALDSIELDRRLGLLAYGAGIGGGG